MSLWNFVGGAANKLLQDREAAGAEARELEQWQKRIAFQQKIQEDAEKAKQRNRILAEAINTKTGKIETARADGTVETVNAPESVLNNARAAEQAARDKAARDKEKFQLETQVKTATTEAQRARAQASLASIARGERDLTRKERETNTKIEKGYFDKTDKTAAEASKEINTIAADIARLDDPEATQRAIAIKQSGADPEEIKRDLRALLKLALQQ